MCYNISNTKRKAQILEGTYNAKFDYPESYQPYYHLNTFQDVYSDIIPSRNLYIITQENPKKIDFASWGLMPSNWQGSRVDWFKTKNLTWNSQAERLFTSDLYSKHVYTNRCLIISDGMYESHQVQGVDRKIPYYFKLPDHELFAFAGIYSVNDDNSATPSITASIITRKALPFWSEIHNKKNFQGEYRMPTVLDPKNYKDWLSDLSKEDIEILANSFTEQEFISYPVSRDLNNQKLDSNIESILEKVSYPELNTQGSLF